MGSTTKRVVVATGGLGFAVLVAGWFVWWGKPPQMGADEEVFKTVDALFTAVTARDEKRLGECEQRLNALKDAGKLPKDAAAYLDNVIHKARDGRWQAAAEKLYHFMKAQRRESAQGHPTAKRNKEHAGPGKN
jgi:hypothetical protein